MKKQSRSKVVKKLDDIFSKYIRLKSAVLVGDELLSMCVTCKDVKPWKQQQCGHFISRGKYPTRWDEDNCKTQCVKCNVFLKGNYIPYTKYMIDEYGREFVDDLEVKSRGLAKFPTVQLEEMIEDYKEKVKDILDKALPL
jgi:hypothetical protein